MKRGYVFSLDAAIAILLLIIGIAILYYQFSTEDTTTYAVERLSVDVIGVLANTRVSDLCVISGTVYSCPRYDKLENLVNGDIGLPLRTDDPTILDVFAEVIETGTRSGKDVEDAIHEIFVTHQVIDEKRFGFSVIYTDYQFMYPLELYNTETYPANE